MAMPKQFAERSGRCCPWLAGGDLLLAGLGASVFALDQVTKGAIASQLPHGASRSVVDGFFNLVHARNTGIAFSLFHDSAPWFRDFALPAMQLAVVVVLIVMLRRLEQGARVSRFALAAVLGGAAGNLYDRLLQGYVTDFLDFYVGSYHWPAFNVADSAITVGVVLLLLDSVFGWHSSQDARSAA